MPVPARVIVRDIAVLLLTVLLMGASHTVGAAGAGGIALAVLAGALVAFSGFLLHEWGHLLGGLSRRARMQPADGVLSIFLFKFDSSVNSREQFLAMSIGGFISSALAVAVLLAILSFNLLADQIALALTVLGVIATFVLEVPGAWKVYKGAPLPTGAAYVSSAS